MCLLMPLSSLVAVMLTCCWASGFLTDNNQTVVEGEDVRLTCNRTQYVDQPVDWKYKQAPDMSDFYICMNGRVLPDFKHRYELDPIDYTLTILNVSLEDTGLYFCTEDSGFGEKHFVHLQVEKRNESEPRSSPVRSAGPLSVATIIVTTILIAILIIILVAVLIWKLQVTNDCLNVHIPPTATEDYICRQLPVELVEMLLMKAFVAIFRSQLEKSWDVILSKQMPYATLSSVCSYWWLNLSGWPDSNTKHWVKHKLRQTVKSLIAEAGIPIEVSCCLDNGKFSRRFSKPTIIGKGRNGEVYKATKNGEGEQGVYAIKKIKLGDHISTQLSEKFRASNKEVIRLKRLEHHRNIVRYYESWIEEEFATADSNTTTNKAFHYYIQLELCTTTLFQWIDERNKYMKKPHHLPEHSQLRKWVKLPSSGDMDVDSMFQYISIEPTNTCLQDILSGLNFMHSRRLAHGDLHTKNILIQVSGNEEAPVIAKMSDFGIAKTLTYFDDQTPTCKEMDEPCDYVKHPFSEQPGAKHDMEQLAGVICDLYYPCMPNNLPEQLKGSGWNWDQVCPEFADVFPVQANWISQLNDSNIAQRPTAVNMLLNGIDNNVFTKSLVNDLRQRIKFLEQQLREGTNIGTSNIEGYIKTEGSQ